MVNYFRNQSLLPLMPTLNEYFTEDQIISHLCKERLKLAESRNDRQCISRLAGNMPETVPGGLLYQLLPSRRQWSPLEPRHRRSGLNPNLLALNNAVKALRHQSPPQSWVGELNRFITAIRARVPRTVHKFGWAESYPKPLEAAQS